MTDLTPLTPMVLTAGQVAELLGLSESTFRNKRAGLERVGFPRKLPGLGKWSAPAVRRWIDTNGATEAPVAEDADLAREAEALEAAYGRDAA